MNLFGIFLTFLLKCILGEKTGTLTLLPLPCKCLSGNPCILKNVVWKFLIGTVMFYLK